MKNLFGTSKGSVPTTTVTNNDPWSGIQPYYLDIFQRGQNAYNNITGPSLPTQQARHLQTNRALAGSPLMREGSNALQSTIRGDYLDPYKNPYFSGALSQTLGDVQSRVNSAFQGNSSGSSAHQEWLGRNLTGAAMPFLSQFYDAERGRQIGAMGMAPQYAANDYADIGALANVGAQQELDPWAPLQRYAGIVGGFGNVGGTATQNAQNPYYQNNTANTLGTAATAAALFFSDRRLKKNIVRVGELPSGIGIYEFNHVNDHGPDAKRYRGVLADEVRRVRPELVSQKDGFDVVDYSGL